MKNVIYGLALLLTVVGCKRSAFDYAKKELDMDAPSPIYSSLTVGSPNYADGITPAMIRLVVKNALGQPIVGKVFVLSVSGEQNTLIPCPPTDINGETTCMLYTTKAETKMIRTVGTTPMEDDVTFDPVNFNRSAAALVVAGDHLNLPSHNKITAVFGDWVSGFRSTDSMNVKRMNSTILAVMPE